MQQVRKEEKTSKGKVLLLQNNVTKDMVRNRREIGEDILLVEKEKIVAFLVEVINCTPQTGKRMERIKSIIQQWKGIYMLTIWQLHSFMQF